MNTNLSTTLNYSSLLELDLIQLIQLEPRLEAAAPGLSAYRDVLISYFRGSSAGILRVISKGRLPNDFQAVALLRAQILAGEHLPEEIVSAAKSVKIAHIDEARAELLFCLTIACIKTAQYEEASRYALLADHAFSTLGLHRKAVKSAFNYLVAQTHLHPTNRFFTDYTMLAERAEHVAEWSVMVTAHLNISREFQKVGALELALESANKAVSAGLAFGNGTRELGFARLQKASVLTSLKRGLEADQEFAQAALIDHPEISAAIASTRSANATLSPDLPSEVHCLARFKERSEPLSALGSMESRLLDVLRIAPTDFAGLADALFPEVVDAFSQRERLKNLIARVRKKQPGLIVREAGCYKLSELRKC